MKKLLKKNRFPSKFFSYLTTRYYLTITHFIFRPVFRNYKTDGEAPSTVEDAVKILPDMLPEIQNQLDLMKTPMEVNDIDISNLAPRKVDWDLKRDINKKLQKLERRTQKAITELIRERMQEKNQENILLSVNVAADEQMQNIKEID